MKPFIPYPLLMDPCFSPRPWGGARLRSALGKPIPEGEPIGESWELSDHPHGRSRVANGPLAGEIFGDLYASHPLELCGAAAPPARFPLLVKYIDASGDLSIQVHPDDAAAAKAGDRGKTECWYVMDCAPGSEVIYGLAPEATAESLRGAAASGEMDGELRRLPLHPGAFLFLPAGTVHAILAGTLLCEVQQSSDLTYRLWDWGRQPPRALHIEEAIEASRFGPGNAPEIIDTRGWSGERLLARCEFFETRLAAFSAGGSATPLTKENRNGLIVCVVGGAGTWRELRAGAGLGQGEFKLGETWFWPAGMAQTSVEPGPEGLRLLLARSLEF